MLTNTERQQIVEEVNAGTYGIDEALDDIAAAQKGEEVRKALYAEALVLNREGHAGSTDMIARQQVANLQTSVNGQISTLRTEVGEDIDDLETALNSGLATQNGRIAAQNATIANVVANYNVEYGSTELWASTGETGALAAGTTVTLSEDVSHFDYIDIYSFCGNSNVLDTVPVDAKLQSSAGYALRWVNLSDPDSGSYKAYVRIIETRLHIIGTTLTIDHQVTYRNGEEVNISGAEITQSNRSTYMGELGIMKIVGRKITANTEIEDVRIGADGTAYNSAGQAVRAQVTALNDAIPAVDDTLSVQGAAADAKVAGDKVAELKSAFKELGFDAHSFSYINGTAHSSLLNAAHIHIKENETFKISIKTSVASNILITPFAYKADNTGDALPYIQFSDGSGEKVYKASAEYVSIGLYIGKSFDSMDISFIVETENSVLKTLALMTLSEITFTNGFDVNYTTGDLMTASDYKYAKIDVRLFQGGNVSGTTAVFPNGNAGIAFKDANDDYITGYRNTTTGVYKWNYNVPIPQNAAYLYLPLRIASESDYIAPSFPWEVVVQNIQKMQGDVNDAVTEAKEIDRKLNNARHIKGNAIAPLTLLHFSDLHNDRKALSRIMTDAENAGTLIDDKICTGDIVANTYEEISSWWDSSVMTCIGNHDTASYNSSTGYNWIALSMANRDAYYIAPFESEWGITHTSGTSYYYKDYATQKVRLIVMDAMLYTGTPGAEATTQTAWLANLLSDAIANSLHVLIAIHSPHGGATTKSCSFSQYVQGTMPTSSDCNTPQTVIDTVASAITNGLHFIGYIVGHTHQDNIWDAEEGGSQLMYCVTCAAVNNQDQWKNSDQYRGIDADAYNLVTIDTTNTLVKIVRGGGADIDDHMRARKAICFNYTTGEKVGEIL